MSLKPDYVFTNPDAASGRQRLLAVQEEFDPDTHSWLDQLGVQPGWTCLEIGCGAGSILGHLADRVGPEGRVLGLDLDPRLSAGFRLPDAEVRQGDVATFDLGEGLFDLAHARFVFVHVRQRDTALANVLRALKPGGWLLLEEPDYHPAGPAITAAETSGLITRMYEATRQMYLATGGDPFLGQRLVGWLQDHGVRIAEARVTASLWRGGSSRARLRRQGVDHLGPRLLATGVVTAENLERFQLLADDPTIWGFDYTTVAAWGRKERER